MGYHSHCIRCGSDCCTEVGEGEVCRDCLKEEIDRLNKILKDAPTLEDLDAAQFISNGQAQEIGRLEAVVKALNERVEELILDAPAQGEDEKLQAFAKDMRKKGDCPFPDKGMDMLGASNAHRADCACSDCNRAPAQGEGKK